MDENTPTAIQPGQRYGLLTILRRDRRHQSPNGKRRWYWLAKCDCGNEKVVNGPSVRTGDIQSCGCLQGKKNIPTSPQRKSKKALRAYWRWRGMWNRCRNKSRKHYHGRGITIAPLWQDFDVFYADMGECPPGLTLERKNNDKGYEPGNCKWATIKEQNRNTRANVNVSRGGKKMCVAAWAEKYGVPADKIRKWAKRGDLGFSLTNR